MEIRAVAFCYRFVKRKPRSVVIAFWWTAILVVYRLLAQLENGLELPHVLTLRYSLCPSYCPMHSSITLFVKFFSLWQVFIQNPTPEFLSSTIISFLSKVRQEYTEARSLTIGMCCCCLTTNLKCIIILNLYLTRIWFCMQVLVQRVPFSMPFTNLPRLRFVCFISHSFLNYCCMFTGYSVINFLLLVNNCLCFIFSFRRFIAYSCQNLVLRLCLE